jgi:hypothetical protein
MQLAAASSPKASSTFPAFSSSSAAFDVSKFFVDDLKTTAMEDVFARAVSEEKELDF